jgi:hypothetical protein
MCELFWRVGLYRVLELELIFAVVFSRAPQTTFPQPARGDLISQGSAVTSKRPCAVVRRRVDELSFASSTSVPELGTSAGTDRFQGFDSPVVTLPRRLLLCRLHYPPAF